MERDNFNAGGIYYKQDMYSFLFTLSVVLIALALSYLFFHGREHTTIGRFIIYCSVNLIFLVTMRIRILRSQHL